MSPTLALTPDTITADQSAIDHLNTLPRDTGKPFAPVVIERYGKTWWIMRAGPDRHEHAGYFYRSIESLLAEWSVRITGFGADATGSFYTTEIID